MLLGFRTKLKLNQSQRKLMAQHAGYSRWVDNLYGSELVIVERFFPSSKTCSNCQDIKQDLTLSDRWFTCNNCGGFNHRDLNASINLASYADGFSVKVCGVDNADVTTVKQKIKSN